MIVGRIMAAIVLVLVGSANVDVSGLKVDTVTKVDDDDRMVVRLVLEEVGANDVEELS